MAAALVEAVRNGDAAADRLLTLVAAGGALNAQRDLLTILMGDPARPEDRQLHERPFEEVARVEILARFCALRGNDQDKRRLAAILGRLAQTTPHADDRFAFALEATGLLRSLADEGDGVASDYLATLVAQFPEVRPGLELADAAILPAPPPIVRDGATLGDILAEALGYEPVAPRPGLLGLVDRARSLLSDWGWSIHARWWTLQDRLRRLK